MTILEKGINKMKLKNILLEMPMLGKLLSISMIKQIENSLNIKLSNNDMIFKEFSPKEIGKDFYFIESEIGGDSFKRLVVLFNKVGDTNVLCFASVLEQMSEKIEGSYVFKVRFSNKYSDYVPRVASIAYINFIKHYKVMLCCDQKMSDRGAGIWMELLTRPNLHEDMFVWNLKEKRRESAIDFKDIFGEDEKYKNYIVVMKPKLVDDIINNNLL